MEIPSLTVVVGTYDGVLAGWKTNDSNSLEISFATPAHGGSIRGLALSAPGPLLLSCGYDEYLQTHDFKRHLTSSGQIRTPSDMGTPVCSSFGPPYGTNQSSSHCLVGFSSGQLVIYKKRDWSVQHVLKGHQGGIGALSVHPTGKLALTGGETDGKLKCFDLIKGRLAYASKIKPKPSNIPGRIVYDPIVNIVWNQEGTAFAFAYGSRVTVRDVATGKDLLDLDLPCKVNQICLLEVTEGLFVVAAGNDGSLPVLAVNDSVDSDSEVRRAILAIEPVDGVVAGEERYKCIQAVQPNSPYVVTANSGGVVSLLNLQGAINILLSPDDEDDGPRPEDDDGESDDSSNTSKESNTGNSDDESSEGEEELAVDIVDSIQLGSGSRITCMVVFCHESPPDEPDSQEAIDPTPTDENDQELDNKTREEVGSPEQGLKRKRQVAIDPEAMDKARALVSQAKKIQEKKDKKRKKRKTNNR